MSEHTTEDIQIMRDRLHELVAVVRGAYPMVAEGADQERDELNNNLMAAVRGCIEDKDVEVLSLICAWFITNAPKSMLLGLLMFLEDDDEQEN